MNYAERRLKDYKWKDLNKKHQFINDIAFLCSLSEPTKEKNRTYCDTYAHMMIKIEKSPSFNKGRTFYSFRNINQYSIYDLINNTITLASPKCFNDPLDSLILTAIEKQATDYPDSIFGRCLKESLEKIRIRCFTPEYDLKTGEELHPYQNTLMWAHYAGGHTGMCIKYKFSPEFPKDTQTIVGRFGTVKYKKKPIKILGRNKFEFDECFLTKQDAWKYEKEVRLIYFNAENSNNFQSIVLDEGSQIEAIFFGCKCSDQDRTTIIKLMGRNIKYYIMGKNYNNIYELKPKRIYINNW